jgi:DNA invertase Pin-like site-specific DNA recombinase
VLAASFGQINRLEWPLATVGVLPSSIARSFKNESVPGLKRAKDEGKRLGRPPIARELEERIRKALNAPGRTEGVRKIAARFGVDPGTVQRISRPFANASVAAA